MTFNLNCGKLKLNNFIKMDRVKAIFIILLIIIIIILLNLNLLITSKPKERFYNHNDFKIVMFLTGGLCQEAENCIQTIKNQKLDNKLLVTALDDISYKCMNKIGINVERKKTNLKLEASFGTRDFYEIVYNKLEIIEKKLKEHNTVIVYSDSDIVFLKDISEDVEKFKNSKYDIMFQNDIADFGKSKGNLCSGFMFFKNNIKTKSCLSLAMKMMKHEWDNRPSKGGGLADQKFLNKAIKKLNINVGVLNLKDYPNGARYFRNLKTKYNNYKPKIVHNNYIVGTKNKIERFKQHNLWFI